MTNGALKGTWGKLLQEEFNESYMKDLKSFLQLEKKAKVIYPRGEDIFNAFNYTPYEKVKVVLIGQDPYHGPNQAHGLCFSVKPGIAIPKSLINIYKELESDLGVKSVRHGCLTNWAEQGVLMLNSVLTVEQSNAGAHQGKGWERFTDKVVEILNAREEPVVFILWGKYAQDKGQHIDEDKHFVIKSVHPSPLSARRGFLGSKPFSQTNKFLKAIDSSPIDWQLPVEVEVQDNAESFA